MKKNTIHRNYIILGIGIGLFIGGLIASIGSINEKQVDLESQHREWAKAQGLYTLKEVTNLENEYYLILIQDETDIKSIKKLLIESKLCIDEDLEGINSKLYKLKLGLKKIKTDESAENIIENLFEKNIENIENK